jgi:hypothetical protein
MGVFSAVTGASVNGGGVYFLAGTYKVKIVAVKMILSRMGENMFVIETEILESDAAERRPGTKCSQVINLSKHESAPGNIKGFMAAALDVPADEITEAECDLACTEENPLAGTIMRLACTMTKTRRNTDFTIHQWAFISEPDGAIKAPKAAAAPAPRAAAAPPPPAPAVPAPPAAKAMPPGYQPHPTAPGWLWNPQTNDVRQP